MISRGKTIASLAIGALVLAAGSALALRTGDSAGTRDASAVAFVGGFASGSGMTCATGGARINVALSFENRWNGQWEANGNLDEFAWAACTNHWAHGYLNTPNSKPTSVANAQPLNLSTLPLMR